MVDSEVIVALIALIISLFALFTSLLQVFQQYYASAAGYSSCKSKVIGPWGDHTHRYFKWKELRFEVRFFTPVIYLAPPGTSKGPIPDEDVWEIRGDPESRERTMTPRKQSMGEQWGPSLSSKELVHTADNETSTWLELLVALQNRELQAGEWSSKFAAQDKVAPGGEGNRTLAALVQKKSRSWDTMPGNVKKPYATTTICHLIELAALLGLHWKEFRRSTHRYRAEGNGYILTGEHIADLGIMFTFQKTGLAVFEENSIIPVDEIKDMCFGFIPTLFRDPSLKGAHLEKVIPDPDSLEFVQLGSREELMQTMVVMGCNNNTVNYLKSDGSRSAHLFPIAFEIIGMLSRVMHIRRNPWRILPNPTIWHWEKKSLQMPKLLEAFFKCIDDPNGDVFSSSAHLNRIRGTLEPIIEMFRKAKKQSPLRIPLLDHLHDAISDFDKLLSPVGEEEKSNVIKVVTHVIRYHLQAVFGFVNSSEEFKRLDSAQPEERELMFMKTYFRVVRGEVLQAAEDQHMAKYANRVDTLLSGPNSSKSSSGLGHDLAPPRIHIGAGSSSTMLDKMAPNAEADEDKLGTDETKRIINDIWCTLIFRMLCWLTLHDFHKKDVQVPKSELIGSRLPVYIS